VNRGSDNLDEILRVLREAGQPAAGIEERALIWHELLQLLDGDHRGPHPARAPEELSHRSWQEFQFVAATPEGAARIPELLRELGLAPGRPFVRNDRSVIPVYSQRHRWLGRLLDLSRMQEAPAAPRPNGDGLSEVPTDGAAESDGLSDIVGILREAGLPADGLEDKARLWGELRPLVTSYRRSPNAARRLEGETYRKGWEIRLVVASADGADRLARTLRQLGIEPGRSFVKRDQVVVPVYGRRHQWLGRLLGLGELPESGETPTPSPTPTPAPDREPASAGPARRARGARGTASGKAPRSPGGRASRERATSPSASPVAVPPRTAYPAPVNREPDNLADIVRVLVESGHAPEGAEAKARAWYELLPLIFWEDPSSPSGTKQGAERYKWQVLQFVAATPVGVVRISELLLRLGIEAGRPYQRRDQILVPVYGQRHQWLLRLLDPSRPLAAVTDGAERSAEGEAPRKVTPAPPDAETDGPSRAKGARRVRRRQYSQLRTQPRSWPRDGELVLQIVATDRTFALSAWQGKPAWAGRCLQCEALLLVGCDGAPISSAQIVQLAAGQPDDEPASDVSEQGLVCLHCVFLDRKREQASDPRLSETLEQLRARRRERWRDTESTPAS
jgi:hypothetical protein